MTKPHFTVVCKIEIRDETGVLRRDSNQHILAVVQTHLEAVERAAKIQRVIDAILDLES